MTDKQAKAPEPKLRGIKDPAYRKIIQARPRPRRTRSGAMTCPGSAPRPPDRYNEVVIAGGMDDSQFAMNPIVTLNHCYSIPPIGRSLWRKVVTGGVKAKTLYPQKPDNWGNEDWPSDQVFGLI